MYGTTTGKKLSSADSTLRATLCWISVTLRCEESARCISCCKTRPVFLLWGVERRKEGFMLCER